MCGGIGSRFWPYSRENYPKQFIDFFGTGRSLLQMCYDRILPLVRKENIIVVTNAAYAPLVSEQLPDLQPAQILSEPARRNTAPCIAWAAHHIHALDPDASMIVTPSDHLITRENVFTSCIERGFDFVEGHDALLTLGINPTRPETGYGYIQVGKECNVTCPVGCEEGSGDIYQVKTFTEKPNLELAKTFLDSGEFFWNSGIFLWKASAILEAIAQYMPDLELVLGRGKDAFGTPDEDRFIKQEFAGCPSISIDYGVMEKADNVYVECVNFGWNDLGTWSALYDNSPKNRQRNVTQNCKVVAYNSEGNIFAVKGDKLIVTSGLKNYIVADSGDVLLICPLSEEQDIKRMVNDVKASFGNQYL